MIKLNNAKRLLPFARMAFASATTPATPSAASEQPSTPTVIKLENIRKIYGFRANGDFVEIDNGEVFISQGKILKVGKKGDHNDIKATKTHDLEGGIVTPGLVDPHTHAFPPQDRSNEFSMRVTHTYQEIAENGGGILSSVKAVRAATEEQIVKANEDNIRRFILGGVTTLEMKSGYGLDLENEIKLLKAINTLKDKYKNFIDIVPTFLGAHAFPVEYKDNHDEYVRIICEEMIPEVSKQKLAEFCDVFCEDKYFTPEQTIKIFTAAKQHGMKRRVHADEFIDSGAANVAAKTGCISADHLMAVSDKGIEKMVKKNVIATILPGTTVFLGKPGFAPARKMLDAGLKVAIGSDFNPGSCAFQSQTLMMAFGMQNCKMTLQEAFRGVTQNAALSLKNKHQGVVEEGSKTDLLAWKFDKLDQIPYYNYQSGERITHFIKKGRVVTREKMEKQLKKLGSA